MYCAIIGDIIQSKELADRAGVQAKLQETLTQINRRYEKVLASDCTITLGDEFQALLYTPVPAFELIEEVQRRMHPVRLRFGVGVGGNHHAHFPPPGHRGGRPGLPLRARHD